MSLASLERHRLSKGVSGAGKMLPFMLLKIFFENMNTIGYLKRLANKCMFNDNKFVPTFRAFAEKVIAESHMVSKTKEKSFSVQVEQAKIKFSHWNILELQCLCTI